MNASIFPAFEKWIGDLLESFEQNVYDESVPRIFRCLGLARMDNLTDIIMDGNLFDPLDGKINA